MKLSRFFILLGLFSHSAHAMVVQKAQVTPTDQQDIRKEPVPTGYFSKTLSYETLASLGVKKDRKLTCQVATAQSFVLNSAQAYGVCYQAQVTCINWGLVSNAPDGPIRRFCFLEASAYLQTCAAAIELTESGGSITDAIVNPQTSGRKEDALVTTDPRSSPGPASDLAESALKPLPS